MLRLALGPRNPPDALRQPLYAPYAAMLTCVHTYAVSYGCGVCVAPSGYMQHRTVLTPQTAHMPQGEDCPLLLLLLPQRLLQQL